MINSPTAPVLSQDPSLEGLTQADRFIQQRQFKEAAGVLNELQTRVQGDPRIFMMGMRLAEAAGQPEGALKAARQAVKIAPDWAPAALDLALLLARQNQFVEAAHEAQRAVGLAPGHLPTLRGAIDIAHRAGYAALALEFLPQAIEITAPNNLVYKRFMALDLAALGRHAEAITLFNELLSVDPTDKAALQGRADSAHALGDQTTAVADWGALIALEPENPVYCFNLAVAQGHTPATQPIDLPRQLFNEMASIYDQHMVRDLRYQLPKKVADLILEKYPDRKLNLLDLGCGTGLLGVCLGRLDGFAIGVDVSEKMLEQASRHQVYDRFHNVNLLDALRDTPADMYEVLTALDVFIYVGDLTQAIADAHRIAKPGGYLIFSCEQASAHEAPWVLRQSKRYAHEKQHVEQLCRTAGFSEVSMHDITLRYEGGQPIEGYWVVAQKAL